MVHVRHFIPFLVMFVVTALTSYVAYSIPQFSLMSGNRCSNCHVNPQGGGIRNQLGWYSYYDVGMIDPESIPLLGSFYKNQKPSNEVIDSLLIVGMDLRAQNFRRPFPGSVRETFPMQASLHAALLPARWLTVEGTFNAADNEFWDEFPLRYPGQSRWAGSAIIHPSYDLPQLRVGFFQPSIGIRNDDHTVFARQRLDGTSRLAPVVPPYMADFGAELTYEGLEWLTASAGVFASSNFAQASRVKGVTPSPADKPTFVGRIVLWERFFDDQVNSYLGSSVINNGYIAMTSVFAGLGLTDRASLHTETAFTNYPGFWESRTTSTELMYQVYEPLLAFARAERARNQTNLGVVTTVNQWVLGLQAFVLPYVVLRPEYRIFDTALEGAYSRYAFQLHVFY